LQGLRTVRFVGWVVWGAALTAATIGTLMPAAMVPQVPSGFRGFSPEHAGTYFVLAAVAGVLVRGRRMRIAAGLAAYGAAVELLQRFVPGRALEWKDVAANVGGAAAGWLVAELVPKLRHTLYDIEKAELPLVVTVEQTYNRVTKE
jgi:VanZ family protein